MNISNKNPPEVIISDQDPQDGGDSVDTVELSCFKKQFLRNQGMFVHPASTGMQVYRFKFVQHIKLFLIVHSDTDQVALKEKSVGMY